MITRCDCGRAVKCFSRKRPKSSLKVRAGKPVGIKDHDLCHQCWERQGDQARSARMAEEYQLLRMANDMTTAEDLEIRKSQIAANAKHLDSVGMMKVKLRDVGPGKPFWKPAPDGVYQLTKAVFSPTSAFTIRLEDAPIIVNGTPAGTNDIGFGISNNGIVSVYPQDFTDVWVRKENAA